MLVGRSAGGGGDGCGCGGGEESGFDGELKKKVMTSEGIEPPIFGSGIRRVAIAP